MKMINFKNIYRTIQNLLTILLAVRKKYSKNSNQTKMQKQERDTAKKKQMIWSSEAENKRR